MISILLKLIKIYIAVLIFFISNLYSEETRPSSGLASSSVFINYSNSIFNTPIEQYKYIKTHRGIEIYETYRHPTNGNANQTIFPKSMPVALIKTNNITKSIVIYKTYTNSIFNKAIEFGSIKKNSNGFIKKNLGRSQSFESLPSYDGGEKINYGEQSE